VQHPDQSLVPAGPKQLDWIRTICAEGIRRPGSEADNRVTSWVADRFTGIGLDDVHLEPVSLPRWEPRAWSLHVQTDGEQREFACFPLPHSAPAPDGVEAPIRSIDDNPVMRSLSTP
jgi:hypothetical protein